ncbi:substrate-binding domain-containing protein [Actinopolymorpha sp. NPDC004070]|uniref:substrate-binding domain-containing protein n=1 Tax=Actinopolymorpha sp. NPDC004070 TaxID=3154548 RepID=UPI0033A85B53
MPGRHAAADLRPRRHHGRGRALLVLVAALALIIPTAAFLGVREFGASAGSKSVSCKGTLRVRVAAAPEMVAPLKSVAARVEKDKVPVGGACLTFGVTAVSPRDMFTRLSGETGGSDANAPDLWVPDTFEWVARTGIPSSRLLALSPSLAASPIVLATTQGQAEKLGADADNWSTLATSGQMAVADAERSGVALSALLGVRRSVTGEAEEARSKLGTVLIKLAKDRVDALDRELAQADTGAGLRRGVPASEQQVLSFTREHSDTDVVAVVPKNGTVLLDYPLVAIRHDAARTAEVAAAGAALARFADAPQGRDTFRKAGFRDYRDLAPPTKNADVGTVKVLPPVTLHDADDVLRSWAALSLQSRLLAVVDVSGSMAAAAGSRSRIELARDAAGTALSYFPDKGEVGLWEFSELRDGTRDYRELAKTAELSAAHRAELAKVLAKLPSQVSGGTGLYDTFLAAYRTAQNGYDDSKVNSVVLLTDGKDEDRTGVSLTQLLNTMKTEADPARPIAVILVGIGPQADLASLGKIADATNGRAYRARDPKDMEGIVIDALLRRQCGATCN